VQSEDVVADEGVFSRRTKLARLLADGVVDNRVVELLFPDGSPVPDEDQYWDFKSSLPEAGQKDKAKRESDAAFAELIKDVVAFHNVSGGYLVIGVQDADKSLVGWNKHFDAGDLAKRIQGLTRRSIDVKFRSLRAGNTPIGVLMIPPRQPGTEPVQFLKAAPETSTGKRAFDANDIYLRSRDECRKAITSEDFSLLFARNRWIADPSIPLAEYIENNLPAKDPNLLDFVGREENLNALWRWFTERYTAVKLLSGPGGVGKTSIAWTFCDSVLHRPPEGLEKIIWLTAKRKTYAAVLGRYVEITHTHFSDLDSLLRSLLSELGTPDQGLAELEERNELIEAAIEALSTWPCLLVVDDVDSLPPEEQFDVFRTVSTIFDRVIAAGQSRARALLTARLTLGAAPGQLMMVEGMPLEDFSVFVKSTAAAIGAPLPSGGALTNEIRRLHKSSSGSPLFAASILRLVSLGESLSSAIRHYEGAEGEEVRRFAFERELDRLTDSQMRLLYAAIHLGDAEFLELMEVLGVSRTALRDDIGNLRDYHLMVLSSSLEDLARGISKVSVTNVIVAMADLIKKKISDPTRIEKACAKVRSASKSLDESSYKYVRQIVGAWREDDYETAVEVAQRGVKNVPKSGDLWCALGRSYLKRNKGNDLSSADTAFRKAHELGCERTEHRPQWRQVKLLLRDWNGLLDLATSLLSADRSGKHVIDIGNAYLGIGSGHYREGAWEPAAQAFLKGAEQVYAAFKENYAHGYVEPLKSIKHDLATAYVNAVVRSVSRDAGKINVWRAVRRTVAMEVYHRGQMQLGVRSLLEWIQYARNAPTAEFRDRALGDLNAAMGLISKLQDKHVDASFLESLRRDVEAGLRFVETAKQPVA
jgi:tetratricopeptide (TPR) repeat protein